MAFGWKMKSANVKMLILLLGTALPLVSNVQAEECVRQGNFCFTNNIIVAVPETSVKMLSVAPRGRYLFTSLPEDPADERSLDVMAGKLGIPQLNWFRLPVSEFDESSRSAVQDDKPWDIAYKTLLSNKVTTFKRSGISPLVIEPEIVYHNAKWEKEYKKLDSRGLLELPSAPVSAEAMRSVSANIVKLPKEVWPSGQPGWHLGKGYSNLEAAIQKVGDIGDNNRVTVAHLDTGYNSEDKLMPEHFDRQASRDFTADDVNGPYEGEAEKKPVHGARTLSTLAGREVLLVDQGGVKLYEGTLGGNPTARVFEYKIGESVVHLNPSEMSAAIARAVDEGADVISLSAGGLPSIAQRKAVNKAYNKGTAIIAATGDFFVFPFTSFTLTPSTVGFPARFNRVIGVAGITERGRSYGKAPCYGCLLKFWKWNQYLLPWMFRGNFGPASVMEGHVLVAYVPNILHSWPSTSDRAAVALDGGGASHATPQVAAAASLWLQFNRDDLEQKGLWRDWRKAEAVYQALIRSAKKPAEYTVEHMGEGVLNAGELLETKIDPTQLQPRAVATIGIQWIWDLVRSWDLLRVIADPLLTPALEEMLATEIQQVILESASAQDLLDKQTACGKRPTAENVASCREDVGAQFMDILLRSDLSSNFLKAAVNKTLDQWIAANT